MANDTYLEFGYDKIFHLKIVYLSVNRVNYFKKNNNSINEMWILVEILKVVVNN